jgi:hypothetical protein
VPIEAVSFFGDSVFDPYLAAALARSQEWVRLFLRTAPALELQQMRCWFHSGHALFTSLASNVVEGELTGAPEIARFVRDVIARHRFTFAGGELYRVRVAISGPRESGKSQLLMAFADELLLEFARNGLWKRTFFVFLNLRLFSPFLSNMADFYTAIVDLTVQNLAWQRPFLRPYQQTIRRLLLLVTTSKSCPRLIIKTKLYAENPQFALALQGIVETLFMHWNNPAALSQWVLNVFMLPSLVSAMIGFDNVFYIIDNFEFADLDVAAPVPFTEPSESCFVAEFLKFVVNRGNFVIAGENQNRLLEVMQVLEDDGCDLFIGTDIVTPIGLITLDDPRAIKFDIQDEPVPFQLTAKHCCGVPAFVALWAELNDAFDEYDRVDGEEQDEFRMLLVAQAQHVLEVMFQLPESDAPLFVTGVRR